MKYCKPKAYYYPLRAIAEFFKEKESEKELSKKLNAKDHLNYKLKKEVLERDKLTLEFGRSFNKRHENDGILGYTYLYNETLKMIRSSIGKYDQEKNLACYILSLKIIS